MITVDRRGWNARPPESTTPLNRSRVRYFVVHYSGASRLQSVRSIQDYCMDTKGHVDIDYNALVRGRSRYVGRGWNVGGHTRDYNSVSYGVCVIGRDGDATDEDMLTVREIYDEVRRALGRQLIMTTHRGLLGASYTSCPGDELHNWVVRGMPVADTQAGGGDVDVYYAQVDDGSQAVYGTDGKVTWHMPGGTWDTTIKPLIDKGVPFLTYKTRDEMLLACGPLVDRSELIPDGNSEPVDEATLERVIRRVLRSVPEA